ncbi:MAG: glutamate-5-semialdehyde dehydrogenase [Cardiobacteriales bacterium]|nr:MAG: glutamate-5-semialdehyde dehydrogenase [Cardiobacteriales bacterium]
MTTAQQYLQTLGQQGKLAKRQLGQVSGAQKQHALNTIAQILLKQQTAILAANAKDIAAGKQHGLDAPLLDRLQLTPQRIQAMTDGIQQIASLPEIIGEISQLRPTAKGLQVGRMRVPLGVIGMIYESRPNVTADAAALCLKSGNAVILRGGSEALHSNQAILNVIHQGLTAANLSTHTVQLIEHTDRAYVSAMLAAEGLIDVIIPRGGKGLVSLVSKEARMPVIKHLDGLCHLYVDAYADINKAVTIADNGKTYRYGICGATETLLVHQAVAATFLPQIASIYREKDVEMRGCSRTLAILPDIHPAKELDWQTEYLAPIISIRIVDSFREAVEHIATYSSAHTDAIVTEKLQLAQQFMQEVDSASVMVNTPTCFADGYEYGLGAEIGISTDKIHWRGPVGIEGLTAQKFIVISDAVTR